MKAEIIMHNVNSFRFSAVLLLLLTFCTTGFSQTINPSLFSLYKEKQQKPNPKMISLEKLIKKIESDQHIIFLYKTMWLKDKYVPASTLKQDSLKFKLGAILQKEGLTYSKITSRSYAIRPQTYRANKTNESIQVETVTGTVTDAESGETLPGVNILVKGTTTGISTDQNGQFKLDVPSLQDTLVVSFMGYQTKEVPINGRTELDIQLTPQAIMGEEMVVVGYGTTRKENLTGAVSTVEGTDLENIPASRVDQVLQGRAAGVSVTQNSGAPGASSTIRIRGGNSIQGNNDPLFVIDGFIAGSNFNLNNLNTSDIKSIEILKDATAISIYGTRGSNGVILITTKNGAGLEAGKPEITINSYIGNQSLMNTVDLLNGPQHAAYTNEDAEFRSASKPFPNPNSVPKINWIDQITRDAPIYNGDISIAGVSPDQKINYYLSGSYFNQQGIVKASGIQKYNFRTNVDVDLADKVKTGVRLNLSRFIEENNKVNFARILRDVTPNRAIYNEEGNYTAIDPVTAGVRANPVANINLMTDYNYVTNLLGNAYIQVEPIKNLVLKSTFGTEVNYYKVNQYNPGTLPQKRVVNEGGDGRVNVSTYTNLLNENTINYSTNLGSDHHIDLLGGFTWQTNKAEGVNARAFGFANDVTEYNSLGTGADPTRNRVGSNWGSYQLVSWLGRASYSYRDKYLLTLVGRIDGSSRFAEADNQYGFFPSVALAWRLSNEPFIKKLNVFDALKIKTSYGISGSQAIGSYRTLALLQGTTTLFNEQQQSGVINGRPANPDLKWEITKQFNIGLETAFLNDRLSFEANYYNKKTEDLLLNVQVPQQTGFESKLQNLGAIRNQGLEFMLSSDNIVQKGFRWTTILTLSGNRNEVLDLGGVNYINIVSPANQGGPGGRLVVGKPVPVFVGVEYLGTWKSQQEIDASGQQGQDVGGPHFKDTNKDGTITQEDFEILGSPQPIFYGGFGNTLSYKNFTFDVFFQGSYGNEIFNSLTQTAFFGRPERNKYAATLDRWTPENRDSNIPRAGTVASLSEIKNNSKEIEDGSYLRLKSLKLTYNIPVQKLGLTGFKDLSVYFSGSNLFLWSDFRLFDPETSRYGSSNTRLGFSNGEYPYARTLTFGFKATL